MKIRQAGISDLEVVTHLTELLWGEDRREELQNEFAELLPRDDVGIFLAVHNDEPVGFAQCQLRYDYVEGTQTSPVGYLEGIFVKENWRLQGVAGELVAACQAWAKTKGCREFASDCELANTQSQALHRALGFVEANRIVCFVKSI
ncbi:MAG: GNAT family N-acetyltransferase [Sutterellaceae bacterium]|nr:GNAT family N-acetyltransferase [Sutterellaceae bacterium]